MSFSYPLGFLILIFIPVLIILYILKNKFTEQTVSSTYIWTLSERFLKRRRPISRIYGILSLILQCLLVAVIALAVAHPQISLPNQARDYCFIIDSSGSMLIKNGEKTRYQLAKDEIEKIINDSELGSTYTLISCAEEPVVVYESISNKESAVSGLQALSITNLDSKCLDALPLAQSYYDDNRSLQVYVASDKKYETTNINLLDVSNEATNFSFSDIVYNVSLRRLSLTGKILSFNASGSVDIILNVDDSEVARQTLNVSLDSETSFSFNDVNIIEDYKSISLRMEALDDLDAGYSFKELDRSVFMNPDKVNARIVIPITDYKDVVAPHEVDLFLYANNYEEGGEALSFFDDVDSALKVFRAGNRMSKGTTTEYGLVGSFFANPFGPVQRQEQTEILLHDYFNRMFKQGIKVGQLRTRLGIKGYEHRGPQEAATEILKYITGETELKQLEEE